MNMPKKQNMNERSNGKKNEAAQTRRRRRIRIRRMREKSFQCVRSVVDDCGSVAHSFRFFFFFLVLLRGADHKRDREYVWRNTRARWIEQILKKRTPLLICIRRRGWRYVSSGKFQLASPYLPRMRQSGARGLYPMEWRKDSIFIQLEGKKGNSDRCRTRMSSGRHRRFQVSFIFRFKVSQ